MRSSLDSISQDLQTYRERVNRITPDDIQRVAQQYLHPDRLSIVLVGDANVFAKQLPAIGFDQVERIPLGQLDVTAPSLRRQRPLEVRAFQLVPAAFVRPAQEPQVRRHQAAGGEGDRGQGRHEPAAIDSDGEVRVRDGGCRRRRAA